MEKNLPQWYRQRRYIHFDEPLSLKKANELVTNKKMVAKHSFWPLITFDIVTSKISQENLTKEIIKKSKTRSISYAAHSDSLIYSYYCKILSDLYEAELEKRNLGDAVLAFRKLEKSNISFAHEAFSEIKNRGECSVVALDIRKFFDTLCHKKLKATWKKILNKDSLPADHLAIYKSLTKSSSVNRDSLFEAFSISQSNPRNEGRTRVCTPLEFREKVRSGNLIKTNNSNKGIPQGTAISALLSNLYMLDFDSVMHEFVKKNNGKYMRYCDDMLLIMPSGNGKLAEDVALENIQILQLEINKEKTDRSEFYISSGEIHSSKPLQYLGFLFDGKNIIIRSAAFAKYSNRFKRGVSLAKKTMRKRNELKSDNGAKETDLYRKKLYSRYSHLGQRNFIRYGHRAAKIMKSTAIKKQLRPLWNRLIKEINSE